MGVYCGFTAKKRLSACATISIEIPTKSARMCGIFFARLCMCDNYNFNFNFY